MATWRSILLAGVLVGAVVGSLGGQASAGACSMATYSADFDGTVVVVDGPNVTYRVDYVRQSDTERLPGPGETVIVHYPEAERDLVVGESYRIKGWNHLSDGIGSQIAYDFDGDCGSGAGTTTLGGAYLGASSSDPDRRWPFVAVGFVALGGAVLAVHAFVAHRKDQAPN